MKIKVSLLFLLLVICSCSETIYEYSSLSIKLTDAPANYQEVWIDINAISLNYIKEDLSTELISLQNINSGLYNLLDYQNGKDTLLASTDIISGRISEIRLFLGENSKLMTSNGVYDLKAPSGVTSGLEIKTNETIDYKTTKVIYLDFDANKSIVENDKGGYLLKPVIRAYTNEKTGGIEGKISPIESKPTVSINIGSETYETITDATGYFCINGILPGNYNINIIPLMPYIDQTLQNIIIVEGEVTNLDNIELIEGIRNIITLDGDLNINPATSEEERFVMQTPSNQIDIDVIKARGDNFKYNGPATEIKVMPKAGGSTLTINGNDIDLDKSIRYTISSTEYPMTVDLRNIKSGNGAWWIYISGENITIRPNLKE